jgi:hypothetical protein
MMTYVRGALIVLWAWATNKRLLPSFMALARYRECLECDHLRKTWLRDSCALCGCTLCGRKTYWCKPAYPDQECPAGRWGKVEMR